MSTWAHCLVGCSSPFFPCSDCICSRSSKYFIHKICIVYILKSSRSYGTLSIRSDTLWRRILLWSASRRPTYRLPTSRLAAGTCGHEEGCENGAPLTACDDVRLILIASGHRCYKPSTPCLLCKARIFSTCTSVLEIQTCWRTWMDCS